MTLMRGYGENMKLQDWLNTRIFPFEGKMGAEAIYWGVCLGVAEMFRLWHRGNDGYVFLFGRGGARFWRKRRKSKP